MRDFDKYVQNFQTDWRLNNLANQKPGRQNEREYPWILPKRDWESSLWSGIRSGNSNSLPTYLCKNNVMKHDGVHNLKSSWVLCANLYFPFQQDHNIIAEFLKKYVLPTIATVDAIELEYAEKPPLDPTTLLGEPEGQRGKNQTSPDVAFLVTLVDGSKGLILTESKFTEHSFYGCSGRKASYGNPHPKWCMNFKKNIEQQCYMTQWALGRRTNRKYWDYIHFSEEAYQSLRRCPAANAGYQLFRQQALAEAIAQRGSYEVVVSCVAYDDRNESLTGCLRSTGINDFTKHWDHLFSGKAKFACFTHQQWVNWVQQNDLRNEWQDWLRYIKARYGF